MAAKNLLVISSGLPEECQAADTCKAANLPTMVGDSGAGGTKGAVPAPAAGDAAANKFLKADGNWTAVAGSQDEIARSSERPTADWTVPANTDAMVFESLTLDAGIDITVPSGSRLAVSPIPSEAYGRYRIVKAPLYIGDTATAVIGRHHVCYGGTTAGYGITLPAASGNAGRFVSFYGAQSDLGVVSIDGNGSETISGNETIFLLLGQRIELYCDGSNWQVAAKSGRLCVGATYSSAVSTIGRSDFIAGRDYEIELRQIVPEMDAVILRLRVETGGFVRSGAADYHWSNLTDDTDDAGSTSGRSVSDAEIECHSGYSLGNATGESGELWASIQNPVGATLNKVFHGKVAFTAATNSSALSSFVGRYTGGTSGGPQGAITGVEFSVSSGTFSARLFIFEK